MRGPKGTVVGVGTGQGECVLEGQGRRAGEMKWGGADPHHRSRHLLELH